MIGLAWIGVLIFGLDDCFGDIGRLIIEPEVEIESTYHSFKADLHLRERSYSFSQAYLFPQMDEIQIFIKNGRVLSQLDLPSPLSNRLLSFINVFKDPPEIEDNLYFIKFVTSDSRLCPQEMSEVCFCQGSEIEPGQVLKMFTESSHTDVKSHYALYLGQQYYLMKGIRKDHFKGFLITTREKIQSALLLEKAVICKTPL